MSGTTNCTDVAFTEFVDVADREELFEILDNSRILELSQMGGGEGFSSAQSIARSTGVETRRILSPGVDTLDVGVAVAEKLQDHVGFDWKDCPAIGLCHSHVEPDRARHLGRQLANHFGVDSSKFYSLNHGCAGFLELVRQATGRLIELPEKVHIPLLTVETPDDWHDAADRAFCGIVSVGATGTTLWNGPGHRLLHAKTKNVRVPQEKRNNGTPLFHPVTRTSVDFFGEARLKSVMTMDGEAVFENGAELMLQACRKSHEEIEGLGRRVLVVPHQPSGKMLRALIATAGYEMQDVDFLNNLRHHGNMISSSIPSVLARLQDVAAENGCQPVQDGDVIVLAVAGICMAHPADHFAKGRAALIWQDDAYRL